MKSLDYYINEKLHISNYKNYNIDEDIRKDIIMMINTFCTLFNNVNNFFTKENLKNIVETNKINNSHINEVIEALLYFFNKSNNELGVKLMKGYPKENKEEIDNAIIEGIKIYQNKKK